VADPILVLGATGTHGGAIVRALVAAGHSVRGLVRDPESQRAQAVRAGGVELVIGDLMDPPSLTRAFAGVGAVYAVTTPFEHGAHDEERQGSHIIEAASQAGLPWLLLASVAAAGRAPVPHARSGPAIRRWCGRRSPRGRAPPPPRSQLREQHPRLSAAAAPDVPAAVGGPVREQRRPSMQAVAAQWVMISLTSLG
jgi:nucleoside-diphosphate-sugar epimerase